MKKEIQYYLIHGPDGSRKQRMIDEFAKWGLDNNEVKWILTPNKADIDDEFRKNVLCQEESSDGVNVIPAGCDNVTNGQVSCTYKHYLCIKDIVENGHEYGIIMEDNIFFTKDIPTAVENYMNQLRKYYPDWDVVFDSKWRSYLNIDEGGTMDHIHVYPKYNEITARSFGSSRLAGFYIITNKCATELYKHYIPFNHSPDWWMNILFRKLDTDVYWTEPAFTNEYPHVSTVYN